MVNGNDTPAQDATLETRSKELFDASVAELDGSTRSRLCQARHAALAQVASRPRTAWWVPALAATAVAAIVAFLLPSFQAQQPPLSEANLAAADDLTLLMNDENLDLLEEIEFYAWLAETDAFDLPGQLGASKS
jgi:hypothetical protein